MNRVSRRMVLGAGASLLAAPPLVERANAQSRFDWKQFKGEKIEVNLVTNPHAAQMIAGMKEFEELTGIRAAVEQVPEQQQRQKFAIEFASGRPSFDVVLASLHVNKLQMGRAKWCADLRPMIADAQVTSPELDLADFSQGALAYATQPDGRMDSLPFDVDHFILYYNKDLLAQRGIAVPKTLDELYTAAKALTDPAKQQYGFVGRGLRNANVVLWMNILLTTAQHGALDANGRLATDSPDAVWAGQMYQKLLRECAPPGVVGFNWNECQTTFMQGRAAFWIDGVGYAAPLEDPTRSRLAGKLGYAVVPAGPAHQHSSFFCSGLGIAEASRKKGPAWLWVQWATSKPKLIQTLNTGAGAPPRISSYQSEEARKGSRFPAQYFDTLVESIRLARPGLPEMLPVTEFRDTIGTALTNAIGGADVAAELKRATDAFRPVLEQSEKGT